MEISNPPDSISRALSFIVNNPLIVSGINGSSLLVSVVDSCYRSKNGRDIRCKTLAIILKYGTINNKIG